VVGKLERNLACPSEISRKNKKCSEKGSCDLTNAAATKEIVGVTLHQSEIVEMLEKIRRTAVELSRKSGEKGVSAGTEGNFSAINSR
jgi:hypothetical protein